VRKENGVLLFAGMFAVGVEISETPCDVGVLDGLGVPVSELLVEGRCVVVLPCSPACGLDVFFSICWRRMMDGLERPGGHRNRRKRSFEGRIAARVVHASCIGMIESQQDRGG